LGSDAILKTSSEQQGRSIPAIIKELPDPSTQRRGVGALKLAVDAVGVVVS
jgi:hypothetical protein